MGFETERERRGEGEEEPVDVAATINIASSLITPKVRYKSARPEMGGHMYGKHRRG